MTDVVTRLIVRADGSLAVLDQFGKKMSDAGAAADRATGGVARYEAAQRKMQDAQQRGLAVTTESIARRTKEQRVFEQSASAIDKQYALRIRLEREAEKSAVSLANAVALGYIKQEQALELLMRQEQQHAGMLSGTRPGSGAGNFNTANIAAQFQDIGVTAAMGMNPMQIALQQGTQLASVMATMEKPLQGIASGLASVISPLSLLTIGFVALLAAGLQFIDWGDVAKATLGFLADGLEVIAPYAAAAAIGLALLYAPAILSGLVAVVGSLGSVATAVWGVATAIYATVGLPVLLIAGFVALVAAAVIWRDDLTKMLGVDIVGAAQDGVNWIVGAFVGAYNAVTGVWGLLPAAFADIFTMAMNGAIDIVQNGINGIIGPINGLLSAVQLPAIGPADLSEFKGRPTGAAADAGNVISSSFADAQGVDYLGKGIELVQGAASGAADALRGLAAGMDVDAKAAKAAAKEADRQAKAYRDLTRDAEQFIAGQELAAQSLGMTEEATNRLRYEQDMLNKAANDNIDLTPKQTAELGALATAMAAAEEQTHRLTEIYDTGKQILSSFFGDLRSGIEDGKSLWESLGTAATNALDSIADRALSMAADGIFDMIFGAIMGAVGGSGGGGHSLGGGLGGLLGIGHNANGTDNWRGGMSWVGERGPELVNLPRGAQVFDASRSARMAANQNQSSGPGDLNIYNTINVPAGTNPETAPAIAREVAKELRKQIPDAIERHNRNPLRRAS
jgi:regulator of replication initiation timing